MRMLLIGLGAAAAAAVGGVLAIRGGAPETGVADARAARPDDKICLRSDIRLVEGMRSGCLEAGAVAALQENAVLDAEGTALTLSLADPSDPAAPPALVETCEEYRSRSSAGWYAATSLAMSREEFFRRACGTIAMLRKAEPAERSYFERGRASEADIRSMLETGAFGLGAGEAASMEGAEISRAGGASWKIRGQALDATLQELAHADFDGDGIGEILAFLSLRAAGGTAGAGSLGLIQKSGPAGPCHFAPTNA